MKHCPFQFLEGENGPDHRSGLDIGMEVDVLDQGKWWRGKVRDTFLCNGAAVFEVKCLDYPPEVTFK